MARDRSPVLKRCRTLGLEPSALGYSKKPSNRGAQKNTHPKKMSEYGLQLREKQKLRFIYGMGEKQFRRLYAKAVKMSGITGENMLLLLESRLDNVVFRLGYARTRPEARQLVAHGHVLVNKHRVDIPSYTVKEGDEIEIAEKSRSSKHVKDVLAYTASYAAPRWLSPSQDIPRATMIASPSRKDIDYAIDERLVVELYSK